MDEAKRQLEEFINHYLLLSNPEMDRLTGCAAYREVKKKELLLACGRHEEHVWFIRNGYVRFYYFDVRGDEVTSDFLFAPGFATSFRSFITGHPSDVALQAMEDMQLIGWHKKDLYALYDEFPQIERIGRLMTEQVFLSLEKHLSAFLNRSPYERYIWLLKEYPEFIRHIPLVYLASWLGITPETLSRIRRRVLLS